MGSLELCLNQSAVRARHPLGMSPMLPIISATSCARTGFTTAKMILQPCRASHSGGTRCPSTRACMGRLSRLRTMPPLLSGPRIHRHRPLHPTRQKPDLAPDQRQARHCLKTALGVPSRLGRDRSFAPSQIPWSSSTSRQLRGCRLLPSCPVLRARQPYSGPLALSLSRPTPCYRETRHQGQLPEQGKGRAASRKSPSP